MADAFEGHSSGLDSPARNAAAVTPSATALAIVVTHVTAATATGIVALW